MNSSLSSERIVEVPFALQYAKGPLVLDVGKDRSGDYTRKLEDRGITVRSVDKYDTSATWNTDFQELGIDLKFNTILFLSSLEHFDHSLYNLATCKTDVFSICKARSMLWDENSVIIITVPLGREYIAGDFIQWSIGRVERIVDMCDIKVLRKEVHCRDAYVDRWKAAGHIDVKDLDYRTDGAGANAVYMGVWR